MEVSWGGKGLEMGHAGAAGRGSRWQVGPVVVAWLDPGLHHMYSKQETTGLSWETGPGSRGGPEAQEPVAPPGLGSHTGLGTSHFPCRCWVRSPAVHGVLVMGYGGLTSLFNLVVLAWALRVLHKLKAQKKTPGARACRDTVTVLGLTVLLGTSWALAFFSFGVFLLPQLFLFTIFNSLYGGSCAWPGGSHGRCAQLAGAYCRSGRGRKSSPLTSRSGAASVQGHRLALCTKAASGLAAAGPSCSYALPLRPPTVRDAENHSWASGRPSSPHPKRSPDAGRGLTPPL